MIDTSSYDEMSRCRGNSKKATHTHTLFDF